MRSWSKSGFGLETFGGSGRFVVVGVEDKTVIGGGGAAVGALWLLRVCNEFLLDTGVDGSGDLRRGESVLADEGTLSELATALAVDLGSLETASETGPVGWTCGILVADNARCIAAAEGTVTCEFTLDDLVGLVSWLLSLDFCVPALVIV